MMGPFVPDLIPEQLNLVVALILGVAFGYVLEQAGFSSSRRLAGLFYGYDFTVLRVFFTAATTAMAGVVLLAHFGLLDLEAIYVNPTWLGPAVVGGAIMGVGFLLGGYCPGTSLCAAAIGKVDALFFVLGGALGVLGFGEAYPALHHFYESGSLGPILVFDSLGVSRGVFAALLIAIAVVAFGVTTWVERRVAGPAAPSAAFSRGRHLAAGIAFVVLGVWLAMLPDRRDVLVARVSDPQYAAMHPVTTMEPDELAFRIVDHEPSLRIIDLRDPKAFERLSLPGSKNLALAGLLGKDGIALFGPQHIKKVIVAASEDQERRACLLARAVGYENVVALRGGFPTFQELYLGEPAARASDETTVEARFRAAAHKDIAQLIASARDAAKPKLTAKKKIVGGC